MLETPSDSVRFQVFFEFMRGADDADMSALPLIESEPQRTGDLRFDALLAATADLIALGLGEFCPAWANARYRFLTVPWCITDLPSCRIYAMAYSPEPFRRHGIFIDRRDLTSDGRRWKDY